MMIEEVGFSDTGVAGLMVLFGLSISHGRLRFCHGISDPTGAILSLVALGLAVVAWASAGQKYSGVPAEC